jgi:hypothetical protein
LVICDVLICLDADDQRLPDSSLFARVLLQEGDELVSVLGCA